MGKRGDLTNEQWERYEAEAGSIGVAAPMGFFPFSGWKDSFLDDMHGQGMDAVKFFTQKKVVGNVCPKSGVGNSKIRFCEP
jgi:acyl-CoA reductase-like NAD-dependent aldehyde dehydrogenase